jgi:hypothetical protein
VIVIGENKVLREERVPAPIRPSQYHVDGPVIESGFRGHRSGAACAIELP